MKNYYKHINTAVIKMEDLSLGPKQRHCQEADQTTVCSTIAVPMLLWRSESWTLMEQYKS